MSYDPSGGLTGWDLTGFHEGHDTECWRRLGAQEMSVEDSERGPIFGTRFSVWAPTHRPCGSSVTSTTGTARGIHAPDPGLRGLGVVRRRGEHRQPLQVRGAWCDGVWRLKADPMARFAEAAPHTASIVYESQYKWGDDDWMWYRGRRPCTRSP